MLPTTRLHAQSELVAARAKASDYLLSGMSWILDKDEDTEYITSSYDFSPHIDQLLCSAHGARFQSTCDAVQEAVRQAIAHPPGFIIASVGACDSHSMQLQNLAAAQMASTGETLVIDLSSTQGFLPFITRKRGADVVDCLQLQRCPDSRTLRDDWLRFQTLPDVLRKQPPTWVALGARTHIDDAEGPTSPCHTCVLTLGDFCYPGRNSDLEHSEQCAVRDQLADWEARLASEASESGMTWTALQAWIFSLCGGLRFARSVSTTVVLVDGQSSPLLAKCVAGIASIVLFSMSQDFIATSNHDWMQWTTQRQGTPRRAQSAAGSTVENFPALSVSHRTWWVLLNALKPNACSAVLPSTFALTVSHKLGLRAVKATLLSSIAISAASGSTGPDEFFFTSPSDVGFVRFMKRVFHEALHVEGVHSDVRVELEPAKPKPPALQGGPPAPPTAAPEGDMAGFNKFLCELLDEYPGGNTGTAGSLFQMSYDDIGSADDFPIPDISSDLDNWDQVAWS